MLYCNCLCDYICLLIYSLPHDIYFFMHDSMKLVLREIAELYMLDLNLERKIDQGSLSENYVLSDGVTHFFLKKYRFKKQKRIEEIHAVKKYFSEKGIAIIPPIRHVRDGSFFLHDGDYYALFPFVKGRQYAYGEYTERSIVSLGKTLGLLHQAGHASDIVLEDQFVPWSIDESCKVAETLLEKIKKTNFMTPFDTLAYETVLLKKKLIVQEKVAYEHLGFKEDHLLHGDYLGHNIFFDNTDTVAYVFDLEKTGYCTRSYELFRSMMYCFWDEHAGTLNVSASIQYLNAYRMVYPIDADELKRGLRLFYCKMIHGFWVENEHYMRGNTRADCFLMSNAQRIRYLSNNLEKLPQILSF